MCSHLDLKLIGAKGVSRTHTTFLLTNLSHIFCYVAKSYLPPFRRQSKLNPSVKEKSSLRIGDDARGETSGSRNSFLYRALEVREDFGARLQRAGH
jgi:hypothetical protein